MFSFLFLLQKLFLVYTFLKSPCWKDFYFWSQFTTKNISSLTLPNCCFGQNFATFKYFPELVKRTGTLFPLIEIVIFLPAFPNCLSDLWQIVSFHISEVSSRSHHLLGLSVVTNCLFSPYLGGKCWFACSKSSHNRKISKFKFLFWVRVFKDFSHLVIKRDTEWGVFFSPYFGEKCWFAFSKSSHER